MLFFSDGIVLTETEHSCLLHLVPDAESWVTSTMAEKARLRRDALIALWRPILHADASVADLPADTDALAALILARSDYRTRAEQDAAADPVEPQSTFCRDRYNAVVRSGSTTTLFPSGLTVADLAGNCILAYVQNVEEWLIGAVMGMVNRGHKKMVAQYYPIILADPDVATIPATDDGLIQMITARSDYRRLAG